MPAVPLLSITMVTVWILVIYALGSNEDYFKDPYFDASSEEASEETAE